MPHITINHPVHGEMTLELIQEMVNIAIDFKAENDNCFTYKTVQALINKIVELDAEVSRLERWDREDEPVQSELDFRTNPEIGEIAEQIISKEWNKIFKPEINTDKGHVLYTNPKEAPDAIKDKNGDIALSACKICGEFEAGLDNSCINTNKEQYVVALEDLIDDNKQYLTKINIYPLINNEEFISDTGGSMEIVKSEVSEYFRQATEEIKVYKEQNK